VRLHRDVTTHIKVVSTRKSRGLVLDLFLNPDKLARSPPAEVWEAGRQPRTPRPWTIFSCMRFSTGVRKATPALVAFATRDRSNDVVDLAAGAHRDINSGTGKRRKYSLPHALIEQIRKFPD